MTTTPLPPTKHDHPDVHTMIWTQSELVWIQNRDAQWQAYAIQARADLEAENQRLREALASLQMQCNSLAASNWREWQELSSLQEFERWAKSRAVHMEALARAALESKP